jgi:hypothetical protein
VSLGKWSDQTDNALGLPEVFLTMNCKRDGDTQLLCPSARCGEGALMVGIIGAEGKIGYISPSFPVDKKFIEQTRTGRAPEQQTLYRSISSSTAIPPCAKDVSV